MSYSQNNAEWLPKCRAVLLQMETKNITQRALSWKTIVNTETRKIDQMLGLNTDSMPDYNYSIANPFKYLTFLSEWNGIKTRNSHSPPATYSEYERKSRNWLNGRRAPNYGNTLFPEMLKTSEKYAQQLSAASFPSSAELRNLYSKTLLFTYIHKLCTARIAVHQSWKKTNLLCENSVKNMHSNTAKLLQQYAVHDYLQNDINSFPGSLQRAASFFLDQHNKYLARLIQSYATRNQTGNSTTTTAGVSLPPAPSVSRSSVNTTDGDYVKIKSADYSNILQRLADLERKHNDQASQISVLTSKCQHLQHTIDSSPVSVPSGYTDTTTTVTSFLPRSSPHSSAGGNDTVNTHSTSQSQTSRITFPTFNLSQAMPPAVGGPSFYHGGAVQANTNFYNDNSNEPKTEPFDTSMTYLTSSAPNANMFIHDSMIMDIQSPLTRLQSPRNNMFPF